jgi:PAS domain S-box-containing protein
MSSASTSRANIPLEDSIPEAGASLESVLCTEELRGRPSRPPNYEKENRALVVLMSALADSPSTIFQTLAETILDITQCDSAGLSLLTRDGKTPDVCGQRFYWPAIAGMWNPHVGGGTPRNFGPCGDVLDQNRTLLFRHFERRYPYLMPVNPAAEECLLVPFYVAGQAVGTIWAIMHSDRRKFDAEDDRVMASLGKFSSSAYQALVHIEDLKFQVAEREKAEAEVRELAKGLEAKVRRLVEANVVGIVMWNLEGAITGANDAFLRMVQYDREDLASGRVRWTDLTPAEWRGHDQRAVADLQATGIFQPFEKEYFRKDGNRVPVLLGGALFEKGGNEGVAFVLDLSEQKRAEDALRRSEQRWQTAFENSAIGMMMRDCSDRFIASNSVFQNMLGYTESELSQLSNEDVTYQGDRRTNLELIRELLEGRRQHFQIEKRYRRKDGTLLWARNNVALIPGIADAAPFLFAVVEDITQRKQEESARHYSEERHRVVVETASDAVISLDESSAILLANPATTRIFGYDPAELIGKPLTMLMPEFLRKLHEAGFKRYLATGQRHINWQGTELIGLRKNGQEFPVEVSFGELSKDGHRVFTGFIRDISERKQAEEMRKQAQKAIQTMQAELARVSRLTTMGELAASIAHEVNQPLTAVNNNSNACLRLLANQNLQPDVLRRALEEIVADGTRASAIIARIRALIKKAPAEKNSLDVNEVIGEVLAMMGHGFEENRILLQSELAEALPPVLGDRVQLQQVLLNLIMNGVEAMTAIIDRPRLLWVQSRIDESGDVLIAVRDSGTGLGLEADRVFTPFFTTKANGMGMGLSISRSLIEGHGGRLWAAPNSPHGAVFSFTLPITAGTPS